MKIIKIPDKPPHQFGQFSGKVKSIESFYSKNDRDYHPAATKFLKIEFAVGQRALYSAKRFVGQMLNDELIVDDDFDYKKLVGKFIETAGSKTIII